MFCHVFVVPTRKKPPDFERRLNSSVEFHYVPTMQEMRERKKRIVEQNEPSADAGNILTKC
jgi:hypothetical protein